MSNQEIIKQLQKALQEKRRLLGALGGRGGRGSPARRAASRRVAKRRYEELCRQYG